MRSSAHVSKPRASVYLRSTASLLSTHDQKYLRDFHQTRSSVTMGRSNVLPRKACNDNYVRRRETPSLGGRRQHPRVHHEMTDTMGELPGNYESRLVISACSGVSLVPSAWFRCFPLERLRKQSSIPGGGRAIAASSAKAHRGIHF